MIGLICILSHLVVAEVFPKLEYFVTKPFKMFNNSTIKIPLNIRPISHESGTLMKDEELQE